MTDETDKPPAPPPSPTGTVTMKGGNGHDAQSQPEQLTPEERQAMLEETRDNLRAIQESQAAQQPQQIDPQTAMILQCFQTLSYVVRGISVSHPQFGAEVVTACSRAMGMFVGTAFHGNLGDVLTRRRQCREAFLDALAKSPPPPLNPMPAEPQTAAPRGH